MHAFNDHANLGHIKNLWIDIFAILQKQQLEENKVLCWNKMIIYNLSLQNQTLNSHICQYRKDMWGHDVHRRSERTYLEEPLLFNLCPLSYGDVGMCSPRWPAVWSASPAPPPPPWRANHKPSFCLLASIVLMAEPPQTTAEGMPLSTMDCWNTRSIRLKDLSLPRK